MATLYIGSSPNNLAEIPEPKHDGFTVDLQDIDAATTTRTANGTMHRDRVAGGSTAKRKLNCEWPPMKGDAMQRILQAIAGEFFYVRYPDPYTNAMRTAQFYAGDRSAPVYWNHPTQGILWKGLSVNFIEK